MIKKLTLPLLASAILAACGGGSSGTVASDGKSGSVNDVGGKAVNVSTDAGRLVDLKRVDTPAAAPSGFTFPNGFFSFKVTGLTAGATAKITVALPAGTAPTSVVKCQGAPQVCATFAGAAITGDTVTLTLVDGGAGDADGVVNGEIADPFAPAKPAACTEDGEYACKTGETEPLYTYQWALNYAKSFFKDFADIWRLPNLDSDTNDYDLNVEPAHLAGTKGKGVNVLVLDDGVDIDNEDLKPNVDKAMTFNFDDGSSDPTPAVVDANKEASHGTNVAGMIAAAQNGKGVMGIAPRVTLGGSRFLVDVPEGGFTYADGAKTDAEKTALAYGGADWSKSVHVINASFGANPEVPPSYEEASNPAVKGLANLRGGKGALFIKAVGNEFISSGTRECGAVLKGKLSCENPINDTEFLEPNIIGVGAANARGVKSSYSNAGAINWVTGLGGEAGSGGSYGEAGTGNADEDASNQPGPNIFSTDLRGCARGYSRNDATSTSLFSQCKPDSKGVNNNANGDYSHMNGTSAATPTVAGVVSLILAANPNLGWRDVREILLKTARKIDKGYSARVHANRQFDLTALEAAPLDSTGVNIVNGATKTALDLGWVTNAAGHSYSNWYGFGLVDAGKAVEMAKSYTSYLPNTIGYGDFVTAVSDKPVQYNQVVELGSFTIATSGKVDMLQLRLNGDLCVGSVGIFVKSPSGTLSALSTPYNIYYLNGKPAKAENYGLASVAFYGEPENGKWTVYSVAADNNCDAVADGKISIDYRVITIPTSAVAVAK